MQGFLKGLVVAVTACLVAVTFVAFAETNLWWVRMTDFPRLQYAIALVVLLIVLLFARFIGPKTRLALGAVTLAALAYCGIKIGPYFFGDRQVSVSCEADHRLSVMVANVKLENRHAAELLQLVGEREPDMLLALETNEWWDERLGELSDRMPYHAEKITGSYFGMHLFSALPLSETRIVFPLERDTPSILTTVQLRSGEEVRFIGLHPRPPHPSQPSTGRDGQLMWAALDARSSKNPVILAGDFNAVPWERSIERMQRIGKLIDPREVEGFLPTYDAQSWWMSWPLDQVLHQEGLSISSMSVLPSFGSDHYPIEVVLCDQASDRQAPALRSDDLAEAETTLEAARNSRSDQR
ncbi:endonuclease [Aquicoccus sp. SCR17]|nr:endonuclease [Carideicomes alvinocaridis]